MRKLVILCAFVIALMIALPAAVSAADTDTVVVQGSIGVSIDVSVEDASIDFSSMSTAAPETADTDVTVTTSSTSWSVTASDAKTTNKGFMVKTGPVPLHNAFELSNDGSAYNALTSNFVNFMTGSAAGASTDTAYMRQVIASNDENGAYEITVTFTGIAA